MEQGEVAEMCTETYQFRKTLMTLFVLFVKQF